MKRPLPKLLAAAVITIASAGLVGGAQVAYYPFEGNAADLSGNGNNGAALGGVTYVTGKVGLASHFNNTSSYVQVFDSASLRPNQFTIAAWVNPASGDGRILEKGDSNSYWLYLSSNLEPIFGFYDGTYHDLYSPASLPLNAWSLVAGTYDGTTLKVYINGDLVASRPLVSAPSQTSQPLFIGWKPNGSVYDYFDGLIDELRIYNEALSATQIRDLYYGPTPVDGHIDLTFDAGKFTNGEVSQCVPQLNGKLLVIGDFTKVNGITQPYFARLNADGTTDTSFAVTGDYYSDLRMILQPDGKIIVFNPYFTTINGIDRNSGLARLNPDGSVDLAFDPGRTLSCDGQIDPDNGGPACPGHVYAAALQADGKIVVMGYFSYVITGPGTIAKRLGAARFNSDGSFDATFNPGGGLTSGGYQSYPYYTARQNNNKVIVAGSFDSFDGRPVPGLVRLNTDGSFDATFNPGTGTTYSNILGLIAQSDDRLIIFGRPSSFNGVSHHGIIRLNANGAVDVSFTTEALKDYTAAADVYAVAQQLDGKLIVGGSFHSVGGAVAHNVVRLQSNGSRDLSFDSSNPSGRAIADVMALAVRPDGEIFVAGYFSTYAGANRNSIALVNPDGSLDPTFNPPSGLTDYDPEIRALATQPDGKILVGGFFTSLNGVPRYNLVRLNPDGLLDTSFGLSVGTNHSVRTILIQDDGKILIGGGFTAIDGVAHASIARLNADGTIDSSFDSGSGMTNDYGEIGSIYALARGPDGSVYIGGSFSKVNGVPRNNVAKLTSTGALDTGFDPGTGTNSIVRAIAPPVANSGPVFGGLFSQYNGASVGRIVRVDATTGAQDTAFSAANGTGFNSFVYTLASTSDGKYIIGGSFSSFNGSTRRALARINSDGTLDYTFSQVLSGFGVRSIVIDNQKIYAGGFGDGPMRLLSDGSADPTFDRGNGVRCVPEDYFTFGGPSINALTVQSDGKLLAGGLFNDYNGTTRYSLVRLAPGVVSRKVHGAAGAFDVSLPLTGTPGIECRSGGSTNDYQIVVTFATSVSVTGNPQAQVTSGSGQVGNGGVGNGGMVTINGSTVTIPLTNVANAQTISVMLYGVNGSGNLIIPMSVLIADTNANGTVNASDVSQTKSRIGQALTAANFRSDVNANGVINGSDISLIKSRVGTGLP